MYLQEPRSHLRRCYFEGTCTVGDGSCDPPTRSTGEGFCNFTVMQWNTTVPLELSLVYRESFHLLKFSESIIYISVWEGPSDRGLIPDSRIVIVLILPDLDFKLTSMQ